MKRIELVKTLALVFFIGLGVAASHAAPDTQIARGEQPCAHPVTFVKAPLVERIFTLPQAQMG